MTFTPKSPLLLLGAAALLALAAGLSLPAQGQQRFSAQPRSQGQREQPRGQKKIEALKVAYLTKQLGLTTREGEQFWPVYNRYQQEVEHLNERKRQGRLSRAELKSASNQDVQEALDEDFAYQQQALKIKEKYRKEFEKVLPPKKVLQFYRAEKDFNTQLLQELRRRGSLPGPARPAPARRPQDGRR